MAQRPDELALPFGERIVVTETIGEKRNPAPRKGRHPNSKAKQATHGGLHTYFPITTLEDSKHAKRQGAPTK